VLALCLSGACTVLVWCLHYTGPVISGLGRAFSGLVWCLYCAGPEITGAGCASRLASQTPEARVFNGPVKNLGDYQDLRFSYSTRGLHFMQTLFIFTYAIGEVPPGFGENLPESSGCSLSEYSFILASQIC